MKKPKLESAKLKSDTEKFLTELLAFEAEIREIASEEELRIHAVNSSRPFLAYRQSFFFRAATPQEFRLEAASNIAVVDRDVPFIRWIEKLVNGLAEQSNSAQSQHFKLPAYCEPDEPECTTYPFGVFHWVPICEGERVRGGMLFAKETPWLEPQQLMNQRLVKTYAHAWRILRPRKLTKAVRLKMVSKIIFAVSTAMAFVPVPLTTLAPVEVIAKNPTMITAPFEGVVHKVHVEPNQNIQQGMKLVSFEDVDFRSEYEIATQQEAVAEAALLRLSQIAFADEEAKRELAIAKAERELATIKKRYSASLLGKVNLFAGTDGVAVFSNKRELIGRPVVTGESIMQIADPKSIQFEIQLPVDELTTLQKGARIKIFLSNDPLNPIEASLISINYKPLPDATNVLSYRCIAEADFADQGPPRIGSQGTAQLYGEKVPMWYLIFRRPITTFRQLTGL